MSSCIRRGDSRIARKAFSPREKVAPHHTAGSARREFLTRRAGAKRGRIRGRYSFAIREVGRIELYALYRAAGNAPFCRFFFSLRQKKKFGVKKKRALLLFSRFYRLSPKLQ